MQHRAQKFPDVAYPLNRRRFVTGLAASLGAGMAHPLSATSPELSGFGKLPPVLKGKQFALEIGYQRVNFTGAERLATLVNQSLPGPVLRWREGDTVTLRVCNNLAVASSIHWHGIILPSNMDGVPGLSFSGIKPGGHYDYQFKLVQHGTYWYHSHSDYQEQTGLYGAIIIDPREPEPFRYDREYVILLSDWSDEDPAAISRHLKVQPHYYNRNQRTLGDLVRELRAKGVKQTWNERLMWNQMRMNDRDISDVTGYTYTFLMNGQPPAYGWFGSFNKGEKIRLRFINGSSMTFFDVRIPGLKMRVVAADGQNLEPVSVDDFRIGVAETYDVIVEPQSDQAYSIFAQAIDRSGYALGTLAPDPSLRAAVPPLDPIPTLTSVDMGMSFGGHTQSVGGHHIHKAHGTLTHTGHTMSDSPADINSAHTHSSFSTDHALNSAGHGSSAPIVHPLSEFGPEVDMRAQMPQLRLDDPGIGLRDHQRLYGRKVLTYADLRSLQPTLEPREPDREIQLHLTGNMYRYQWSFDGVPSHKAPPINLKYGERLRFTLVNDTMMNHPIHLHGMWSELETGDAHHIPRKHTVIVQPGAKISYLVTADAVGHWAYHCHLLFHMHGMFRQVNVTK